MFESKKAYYNALAVTCVCLRFCVDGSKKVNQFHNVGVFMTATDTKSCNRNRKRETGKEAYRT